MKKRSQQDNCRTIKTINNLLRHNRKIKIKLQHKAIK